MATCAIDGAMRMDLTSRSSGSAKAVLKSLFWFGLLEAAASNPSWAFTRSGASEYNPYMMRTFPRLMSSFPSSGGTMCSWGMGMSCLGNHTGTREENQPIC